MNHDYNSIIMMVPIYEYRELGKDFEFTPRPKGRFDTEIELQICIEAKHSHGNKRYSVRAPTGIDIDKLEEFQLHCLEVLNMKKSMLSNKRIGSRILPYFFIKEGNEPRYQTAVLPNYSIHIK